MNVSEKLHELGVGETDKISVPESHPRPPRRLFLVVGCALALALAWGAYGHWQRDMAAVEAQRETLNFVPNVRVAVAQRQDGPVALTLPGSVLPFDEAHIYARATGYIAERMVDIGSRVHKGDMLVRIAAPDLDAQLVQAEAQLGQMEAALEQAKATLAQARSDLALAGVTNFRTSSLARQGWESKQNADNTRLGMASKQAAAASAEAGVKVAEANLRAAAASVQRLVQLTQYEKVRAPFDGVVTSRSVDVGDLVKADDSGGGTPMFTVQHDSVVRVQVNVPQSGAVGLKDGLVAKVHVPELPGRTFEGKVARNSVALDPASRTMLAQVDVPNPDGTLRPGLYVNVDFAVPRTAPSVVIPTEAAIFNAQGLRVAAVDDNGRVHLLPISIYRDFGTTLELRSGLKGGERLALTPPADIVDGQKVKVVGQSEARTAAK
jgi:HlyD family secretion protein